MRKLLAGAVIAGTALAAAGCGDDRKPAAGGGVEAGPESAPDRQLPAGDATSEDPVLRVHGVADEYVEAYFRQFPERALETGYPDAPSDRLSDRSLESLAAWQAREDSWLRGLKAIDPRSVANTPAEVPYRVARERLEASTGYRSCRAELWNVNPSWTGWQSALARAFRQQPVGTADARSAALRRAGDVPRYLRVEVANLREGLRAGFTASRTSVQAVLDQLDALLASDVAAIPFYDPARRDPDPAFAAGLRSAITEGIVPAIEAYRRFLVEEYVGRAREAIAVSENPGGEACYRASLRYWTSFDLTSEAVHDAGETEVRRFHRELVEIGERSFGERIPRAVFDRLRDDPRFSFASEHEVVAVARGAVDRARAAVGGWFGPAPGFRVVIRPAPSFMGRSGGGFYVPAAADGGRPGAYLLGTHEPTSIPRASAEATAFEMTYPGRHLQVSVALQRRAVHPVVKYVGNPGFEEGWALYAARLADELGLYSSEAARLGLLSNEALRAARVVVDAGIHALGWRRQQAIDYLSHHTLESEALVVAEVERSIAVPGQATASTLGSLEIRRLRREASERLRGRFDLRAFHGRLLERGAIDLESLDSTVDEWLR